MSIALSFHENVSLLTQVVPASYEFKKHFKKGMFDKPNTAGFVHTAYYLLIVYDEARTRRTITWPLLNKKDETQFRTDVRDYLTVLSAENPDMNFPLILMSHLLLAGGTKFLIIMWKLSQIALRAYIERECHTKLLRAPKPGPTSDLAKVYLENVSVQMSAAAMSTYEKSQETCTIIDTAIKRELDKLHEIKIQIFELKKDIEQLVSRAPISPVIAERLLNVEDTEIIKMWNSSILEDIKHLSCINKNVKRIDVLSFDLYNMISSLLAGASVTLSVVHSPDNPQHIPGLYKNGSLVLNTFLKIFDRHLRKELCHLKLKGLSSLSDFEGQIKEICTAVHSMESDYKKLLLNISKAFISLSSDIQRKNQYHIMETSFLSVKSKEILIPSPKILFKFEEYTDEAKLFERLWSSPKKGKCNKLFKRYKPKTLDSPRASISRLYLSKSISNDAMEWTSPQKYSLVRKSTSPNSNKLSPKYSRLFAPSDSRRLRSLHTNAMSTPKHSRLSCAAKKSKTPDARSKVNLNTAVKNLFDLTCEVKNVVASLCKSQLDHN